MNVLGLFPGQGSQAVGMGADFFEHSEIGKELFQQADRSLGFPLSNLCLQGPIERLTLTEHAQPAILLVSIISYRHTQLRLAAAAGHSLGEYSALVAADAISLEDALQLVHKRGRYMQEAVEPGAGKMVAVMGPSEEEITEALKLVQKGVAEIANLNSPGQTVVSGDNLGVDTFAHILQERGGKIIPLNVSAPFHCSLMKSAADKLAKDLDAISFRDPSFPIYANVTGHAVETGEQARALLKQQVCGSVRWTECMLNAAAEKQITHAVEFGAGAVLSKLLKRIKPEVTRFDVPDLKSLEKLQTIS